MDIDGLNFAFTKHVQPIKTASNDLLASSIMTEIEIEIN